MAQGTLFFSPRHQGIYQGVYAAGATLTFTESGTSTPKAVYEDEALTTPLSNPVSADAYGTFPAIFLTDGAYRVVLKTSAGVTVWTQDDVDPIGLSILRYIDNRVCDGRLTLTSGTPVTTADVTAATTVYFAPFKGNKIALYDGTQWAIYTFSQLSIALGTDAASLPYDVFAYLNAGAVAIERLPWTNGTTRATNLTTQDGVLVKSGDATRRYLGTYRTTSTIGQTEDSLTKRLVWNYCNRVSRSLRRLEDTNSWTYTTDTWRQVNASALNQVEVVIGWLGAQVDLVASATAANTNTGVAVGAAIGQNATNTPATGCVRQGVTTSLVNGFISPLAKLTTYPAVGYSYFAWLEYSVPTGTTTWQGDGVAFAQSGLSGSVEA